MRVLVIGAGLSGLAAACHLLGDGHEVTVLEREDQVGGRAGVLLQDGYTFDTGPVVMTMPDLLARTVAAAGSNLADLLTLERLDPGYRTVHSDGTELRVRADMADLRAEIAAVCGPSQAAGFDAFLGWLETLHETEFAPFIDTNYNSLLDLLAQPRAAARLLRLGAFGTLDGAVRRFFTDPRLHKVFSFQALYAGVSPRQARALLAVIAYMDTVRGVWFPRGGMHAIPRALAEAVTRAGGIIALGQSVTGLERDAGGAVRGVRLADGSALSADAVVCTLDLPVAYERLLRDLTPPRTATRGAYSPSCVVWHVGVRGALRPEVAHHNIHFGADWNGAFTALIRDRRLMPDPSRLVTIPSLSDATLAPAQGHSLYVLEPVPHLDADLDWRDEGPRMRDRLLGFLDTSGYPSDIVTEHLVTPLDWAASGLARGTPFALAHTFRQSGPLRPSNVDRRVPGLVFAGSGTQPGVGIPMVLVSGRLAAQRVAEYAVRRTSRAVPV